MRTLESHGIHLRLLSTRRHEDTNQYNSSRLSEAYMHHQPGSSLGHIIACRLSGAKPLSEPMLYNCQLDPKGQTSVKLYSKFNYFYSRKCIRKCCLENVTHFASDSNVLTRVKFTFLKSHPDRPGPCDFKTTLRGVFGYRYSRVYIRSLCCNSNMQH